MPHIDQRHSSESISPTAADFGGRDRNSNQATTLRAEEAILAIGSIRNATIGDMRATHNSTIEAIRAIGSIGAIGAIVAIRNRASTAIEAIRAIRAIGSIETIEAIRNAAIEAIRNAAIEAGHEIDDAAIKAGSFQSA